jgi:hypothetical protein
LGRWAVRAVEIAVFAVLPVAMTVRGVLDNFLSPGYRGFVDLKQMWIGAQDIMDGVSPYPTVAIVEQGAGADFIYPPPSAILAIPLGLLEYRIAGLVFTVVLIAATLLTLRVMGVRDWRCYGAAFLWMPTQWAIVTATLSPLMALAAALAWRYRDRIYRSAVAVGVGSALKVFLWPLGVWLLIARGTKAAFVAAGVAVGVVGGAWAAIGFADITEYPRLLSTLGDVWAPRSYSLAGAGIALDLPAPRVLPFLVAGMLVGIAFFAARRKSRDAETRDRISFVLVLLAALALTPILWIHYLVILIVPVAMVRPRLSPVWVLPFFMFFAGLMAWNHGSLAHVALLWSAMLALLGTALLGPPGDAAQDEAPNVAGAAGASASAAVARAR